MFVRLIIKIMFFICIITFFMFFNTCFEPWVCEFAARKSPEMCDSLTDGGKSVGGMISSGVALG